MPCSPLGSFDLNLPLSWGAEHRGACRLFPHPCSSCADFVRLEKGGGGRGKAEMGGGGVLPVSLGPSPPQLKCTAIHCGLCMYRRPEGLMATTPRGCYVEQTPGQDSKIDCFYLSEIRELVNQLRLCRDLPGEKATTVRMLCPLELKWVKYILLKLSLFNFPNVMSKNKLFKKETWVTSWFARE